MDKYIITSGGKSISKPTDTSTLHIVTHHYIKM
jgi:hypothetical protein